MANHQTPVDLGTTIEMRPIDPASSGCPNWNDHDFKEVYYGHECKKCGLFFAFGHGPWDDNVEAS